MGDVMRSSWQSKVVGCVVPLALFSLVFPVHADQVIPDDLIVQGSACVGFDCVNGEAFGFDTIRLKENNTRIQFNDTSIGSFPTNNWQIRANSSSSGGPNFLGFVDQGASGDSESGTIVFQVDAAAGANALKVNGGGNVGLGTGSPVVKLHLVNGNTPTLRLDQDGSAGFTPQVWDVAGNEANFFVRDATNGSRLVFRILPNAPTNSIVVSSTGKIGLGTSTPDGELHVRRTDAVSNRRMLHLENNGGSLIRYTDNNTTNAWDVGMVQNGSFRIVTPGASALVQINRTNGNLETNGSFISNGTTLNVPDYVFEDDYQLMPLSELKEFVSQQKHLPNVPSGKEIKENSLNLTEMQMRLLEKIEEVTLYTLQQDDQITLQQKQIADLQQTNSQLESRLNVLEAAAQ
jgi:hypothetical protein